ncbi:hypothetical protein ABPG75_003426 [Micractinium tetrahymenae]
MTAAVLHPGQAPLSPGLDGGYAAAAAVDERPTLLVTTVDIAEGRAARIEVRLGDDPVDVARAFCARHGLPDTIVLPLAHHLEENLAEHAAAEAAAGASGLAEGGSPGAVQYAAVESDGEEQEESADEQSPEGTPGVQPSAHSEPSLAPSLAPSGGSGAARAHQPQQHPQQDQAQQQVETSSRSAGYLGLRPTAAGVGAQAALRPTTAPSYRPAAIHSARGAEYFNHPPTSARSAADSEADSSGGGVRRAPGSTGSTGSLPAHNRLYADHFRKQKRLEEERRLRDLEVQLKMEQVHIAPTSNKLAGHRTAGSYRNYGERLYVEGRLDAMRREQEAQRLKEEEARAELDGYTFQPSISKLAQQLKEAEGSCSSSVAAGQRLYQRAQGTAKRQVGSGVATTAERMEAIRREQDAAEVAECSFRPQINAKSARMVEQRQQILRESGLAGYEQLYNDSMRRRMKLEALAAQPPEEATFRPRVNTSSVVLKKLMEGREEGEGLLVGSADVATRLLERGRRYQEKLTEAQRQAEEAPRDPATGRPLFKPKTYRAPQWERNPEGAPIGEYLYSIKAEWDEKAARVREVQERRAQQNASSTFVNHRSERLVDRLKRERFRAIFDYLRRGSPAPVLNLLETVQDETFMDTIDPEVRADVEYAGRLLAKSIGRRQASERLRDCASSAPTGDASSGPPLETARTAASSFVTANTGAGTTSPYGQSTNGEVDGAGFVALMEEVVARTKGLTRQYLLPMPSGRQKFDEPTFRPAIDPKSLALAARLRPESLPAYEVLYKTAEELAAKREEQRRMAEEARLKECIFKPVMVAQEKKDIEGRALKLATELTQPRSKRSSDSDEAGASSQQPRHGVAVARRPRSARPAATASAPGSSSASVAASPAPAAPAQPPARVPSGEQVHFDALERQINEALVRLSLSEEAVAASLRQAAAAGGAAAAPVVEAGAANVQVGQSLDANGYRLDWRAICGSPSPDGMLPLPELGGTPGASSMAGFNPMEEDPEGAGGAPAAVAWADNSQEVVATVVPGSEGGELSGLDLHALASTDLPEHEAERPGEHAEGSDLEGAEQLAGGR